MSEHNPFSKFFTSSDEDTTDVREDIIPAGGHFGGKTETAEKATSEEVTVENEDAEAKESDVTVAKAEPSSEDESSDSVPTRRFIKTSSTPFISVNGTEPEVPTTAKKYTDRLLPTLPERKRHTGYTGKINTYVANHSPSPATPKFIPAEGTGTQESGKKASPQATPAETAASQTRIIPSVIEDKEKDEEGATGVIVEKLPENGGDEKTRLITAKGDLLREIAKSSSVVSEEEEENDDQLVMEGFSDSEEEEEDVKTASSDDEELERELLEVREKRIKNFRFWTKSAVITGETEDKSFSAPREDKKLPSFLEKIHNKFNHLDTDFVPTGDEEYTDPTRRKEIFAHLINLRKSVILKLMVVGVIGVVLLLVNIITMVSASLNNGFFEVFGGSGTVYNAVNIVLLLLSAVLMFDDLKKGLFSVLKIRPKTDSILLFVYVGAFLQNIIAFFSVLKPESDYHMLTGAAVLMCIPVLVAKLFYYDSARHCFKAVAATSDKNYLRKISDTSLIAALLKDNSNTETNVVYAGKTRFISGFLKRSAAAAFAGQASSKSVAFSMAAAIIAGLIGLIMTKSPVYALGCLTATAVLSFPVSCLVFTGYVLKNENSVLSVKTSFVESYQDAHSFCCIDDIVIDGSDVFNAEIVSSACSNNVANKQAEFCAAVLTHKAQGMLQKAFSGFSQGLEDRFPEVEGLVFEDKLGLSAWISDCKVLLGTKDFLVNHNVTLPKEHTVPFVLEENCKPLFLAIEGHFAAVFSVKYSVDSACAKSLCELAENGANILISVTDPNITEEFGEKLLGLPENSLRIIKSSVNEKFTAQKNTVTDSEETGIVFSDSFDAFARTMASAIKLDKTKKTAKYLCEAVAAAGAVFGIILSVTGAKIGLNSWLPVVLQVFWILLSFVVTPVLCATSLKAKIKLPENVGVRTKRNAETEIDEDENDGTGEEDEDAVREEEDTSEKEEETESIVAAPIFSENSPGIKKDDSTQLIMEGAPYTQPPELFNFSEISGEEIVEDEEEGKKLTITEDILDSFAGVSSRRDKNKEDAAESDDSYETEDYEASEDDESGEGLISGILGRIGLAAKKRAPVRRPKTEKASGEAENTDTSRTLSSRFFALGKEETPPPPRYDLGKKEESVEEDPLSVRFVPPETDTASAVYTDSFFDSFDTNEDDKAFEDVRRRRKAEEDGSIFDF